MELYKTVYPIYIGEKLLKDFTTDFGNLQDCEGFIGFGTCDFKFLGKKYESMIAFNTAENRERGGLKLEMLGYDMNEVALSSPIELKNPMPCFADYRKKDIFRKELHSKLRLYNDVVRVSREQMIKIVSSIGDAIFSKRLLLSQIYNLNELPLPNMSVIMGGYTYNFATNRETKSVVIEYFLGVNKIHKVELTPIYSDETKMVDNKVKIIYQSPTVIALSLKHSDLLDIFLGINYFIKNIPSTYHKTAKKVEETISVGKGIHKKYKRVVYLKNEYDFEELENISKTHIKHIFSCLCWGVRGHFRHLKSGKVIFIQPFKKGKERNNLEAFSGKEYRI